MARLTGTLVSEDAGFRAQIGDLLRFGPVAVSLDDGGGRVGNGNGADVVIVDGRRDAAASMRAIERMRAASSGVSIFMIAGTAEPDLILQSMRAGANEFFSWPLESAPLYDALARAASRAQALTGRPQASLLVFIGAKGGVGTTTLAVNTAVDLARLGGQPSLIVDLKPGLGEVGLFLGMRCRYTLFDALENLHRLDDEFLRELLGRHKSGLEVLSGSEQFDRPGQHDGPAIEEVLRLLSRQYAHIVIDAGTQLTAASIATLYAADAICLVANPDVASVRNAQRLLDRLRQLGPCGERVRVLLNRAAEPFPIPPAQIETALGHPIHQMFPSDYKTVAAALNSGVPLTLAGNSELAQQFEQFTRPFLGAAAVDASAPPKRSTLGIQRLASLW